MAGKLVRCLDNRTFFVAAWNWFDHCHLHPFFDSTDKQQNANTLRAPAAPAAQGEAPPPIDDLDHSDAEERPLAKYMQNVWSAVDRKRQACTRLTALGSKWICPCPRLAR